MFRHRPSELCEILPVVLRSSVHNRVADNGWLGLAHNTWHVCSDWSSSNAWWGYSDDDLVDNHFGRNDQRHSVFGASRHFLATVFRQPVFLKWIDDGTAANNVSDNGFEVGGGPIQHFALRLARGAEMHSIC